MKIAFLIAGLHTGGAQRQLSALAVGLHTRGHAVSVFALRSGGIFRRELERAGIRVVAPMGSQSPLGFLPRLIVALVRERADVVHAYLATANVLSVLLRPLLPGAKIVWGLRMSETETRLYPLFHRLVFGLERRVPVGADLLVANAAAVGEAAIASGMPAERIAIIANGFDADRFRYSAEGRARWRSRWGFEERHRVVGLIARLDPMKGHEVFLQIAGVLAARDPWIRFVCVGSGEASRLAELQRRALELGVAERLIWQAPSRNVHEIYSAVDLVCSTSSFGEGFPNVLAEALLCGTPCVATNVGDVAEILAEPGVIVPRGDVAALVHAVEARLRMGRSVSADSRRRLLDRFPLDRLIVRTEEVLQFLVGERAAVSVQADLPIAPAAAKGVTSASQPSMSD